VPNVPLHLFPPVVVQAFPAMVTGALTSHLSSTGSGPAAGFTVKKLLPPDVEIQRPEAASYWSCFSAPATTALTFTFVRSTPPKSTVAATPTEHATLSNVK
jgi:hypothetical protein